jgi:hypothetical protein
MRDETQTKILYLLPSSLCTAYVPVISMFHGQTWVIRIDMQHFEVI